MEILIFGVILVALMAYASTKIKKTAAEAFAAETIETDQFTFQKPEGFLIPIREDSEFAIEARSKEFGDEKKESKIPKAAAVLRITTDFEACATAAREDAATILSEEQNAENGNRQLLLEYEKTDRDISFYVSRRIISVAGAVYDLTVTVLDEAREQFLSPAAEIINNFRVKLR
jgi:hypothetical protein